MKRETRKLVAASERFSLHHGLIDTLPDSAPFDAATSFLVSHFITDAEARGAYFRALAYRLAPGALLVNADLVPDLNDPAHKDLMALWLDTLALTGMDEKGRKNYLAMFGKTAAAHPPHEVEQLIAANGFTPPIRFYQAAMIHAWFCKRLPA